MRNKEQLNLSKEELEIFFNKYSIIELESFSKIFELVHDYEMKEVLEVSRKVYKEKYDKCFEEYEAPVRHYNYSVLDITKKNDLLNDKELKFLSTIVENAAMFLSSIQSNSDAYKQVIEDFSCSEYGNEKIYELEYILSEEMEKRKNNTKRLVLKMN